MKILVVDDDDLIRRTLCRRLESRGHHAVGCETADLARTIAPAFDAIVSDLEMPGMSGLDLLRELEGRGVYRVLMTGSATLPQGETFPVLAKPVSPEAILDAIDSQQPPTRRTGE